jgi:tryptophanyl-tRNA synthetase
MLDDPKVSAKKIRSAVTDSGSEVVFDPEGKPGISNLLTIHAALTGESVTALEEQYAGRGYGDFKKDLADIVVEVVTPFRDRTLELLDDQAYLTDVLSRGHEQASAVAEATLRDVFARVGFVAPAQPPGQ